MKNLIAVISICFLFSCSGTQGPIGPQGPKGDPGDSTIQVKMVGVHIKASGGITKIYTDDVFAEVLWKGYDCYLSVRDSCVLKAVRNSDPKNPLTKIAVDGLYWNIW